MKTTAWRLVLALSFVSISPASSAAEGPSNGIDPSLVIEEFDVFSDGDMLLVPVNIGGKKHTFWVDTGYSVSGYDKSLRPFLCRWRPS